ncbi:MAG: hypothetical protein WC916_05810 [Candidatus Woesearchaeota archaeon]
MNNQPKENLSDKIKSILKITAFIGSLAVLGTPLGIGMYQEVRRGFKKVDEYVRLKQELDTAKTTMYIVQQKDTWKTTADKFYIIDSSKYPITYNEPYFFTGRYAVTALKGKPWTAFMFDTYCPEPGDTLQVPTNKK